MNIDEFLDTSESYGDATKNSLLPRDNTQLPDNSSMKQTEKLQSAHTDEIDFLNESISHSWDDQVQNLVSLINQSVAEDEYDFAIQKYLELKELPSKIIEADLRTQAKLKEELAKAHEKLTVHMKELEEKHSEQTSELKQLIAFAFEELSAGNDKTASNLYMKACGTYNQLPQEFQARNVKLHYDLLKLFFAIKEAHDVQVDQQHSDIVDSFNDDFTKAMSLIKTDTQQAKDMHNKLHDQVLSLPNEEIRLKSELLEKLVTLKNNISVVETRGKVSSQNAAAQVAPIQNQLSKAPPMQSVTDAHPIQKQDDLSEMKPRKLSVPKVEAPKISTFEKKESPLVSKKEPVEPEVQTAPPVKQVPPAIDSDDDSDVIRKLRAMRSPSPTSEPSPQIGGSEHMQSMQERAKAIRNRLKQLHSNLQV